MIHKHNIIKTLVILMGISISLGEKFNEFIPNASLVYVFIGFLLMLTSIIFYSNKIIIKFSLFFMFFLTIILSTVINYSLNISFLEFIDYYKPVIFISIALLLVFNFKNDSKLIGTFLKSFIFSYVFVFAFFLFKENFQFTRFSSSYMNPNSFAFDSLTIIFSSLYLLLSKDVKHRFLYIITIIVSVFGLILSGTRSSLLGMIIGILLIPLFTKKVRIKSLVLIGSLSFLILILYQYDNFISDKMMRFLYGDSQASSYQDNLRYEIWKDYLINVKSFFWFGLNINKWNQINDRITHNTFLFVFVNYGFLTILTYIILIISTFKKYFKNRAEIFNNEVYIIVGLLSLLFTSLFIDIINFRIFWIWFLLSMSIVNNSKKTEIS